MKFVRTYDFSVSIRSGNNSYEGLSTANEIVIDLTFLTLDGEKQFEIHANSDDPDQSTVRVASGVRLGVLYTELANAGFAFAGGQCAPVCVGGLVGTGGVGFSTRRYGWACDQLISVECVLADGSVVNANANENADLYKACKGAGAAGLCVMTILTLRLHPVVPMLWWSVFCDLTKNPLVSGAKVLTEWQYLTNAPPELSGAVLSATAQPTASVSSHGWYRAEDPDDDDPAGTLRGILDKHRLDQLPDNVEVEVIIEELPLFLPDDKPGNATIEAATIGTLLVPMPFFNQWKLKCANTFRFLSEQELQPVFDYLQRQPFADPTTGVGYVAPFALGGKVNSIDPDSAVVPVREGGVLWVHYGAQWNDDAIEREALDWVDGLTEVLDDIMSDTAWFGIADLQLGSQLTDPPNLDYMNAYFASDTHDFVDFLVAVKNKYDPDDLFQFAQSIPLAMV